MIRHLASHFVVETDPAVLRSQIIPVLLEAYGQRLEAVFLFGSRASDRANEESDLDLMIVLTVSSQTRPARLRSVPVPPNYNGPPLSPVVLTQEELRQLPPIALALLERTQIWYSRPDTDTGENRADQLLAMVRKSAEEQGLERVAFRGGHYWRSRSRRPGKSNDSSGSSPR